MWGWGGVGRNHEHECPLPHTRSGSGPDTLILVAIQHFHIISTEVLEMLNVGACAFECDCIYMLQGWSACIWNKFMYLLYKVKYCIFHIFTGKCIQFGILKSFKDQNRTEIHINILKLYMQETEQKSSEFIYLNIIYILRC